MLENVFSKLYHQTANSVDLDEVAHYEPPHLDQLYLQIQIYLFWHFKGRFLLFQVYCNFANSFFKLSVSTFNKEISKFQQKVQI